MHRGYIKIWRKIEDSGLIQLPNTLAVFMHILLNASHKDMRVGTPNGFVELQRGQYISGRIQLASRLNQSQQQIRTSLDRLVKLEILTITSTNKYSIYTIENYDNYQDSNQQTTSKVTNKQPTDNQQITTKQELKHLSIKEKQTRPITLEEYLIKCKQEGSETIPKNDSVFEFAEKAGIPLEFLRIAWLSFRDEFKDKPEKKQKDWVQTFRNYVRNDYLKIWNFDKENVCYLTPKGKQLMMAYEGEQR